MGFLGSFINVTVISKTILLLVIIYSHLGCSKPIRRHNMDKIGKLSDINKPLNYIKHKLYPHKNQRRINEPKQVSEKCCVEYEPQVKGNILHLLVSYSFAIFAQCIMFKGLNVVIFQRDKRKDTISY